MNPPRFRLEERRVAHAAELFEVLRDPSLYAFLDEAPPESVEALAQKLARSESRRSPDGREHWLNWVVRAESGAIAGYVQSTVDENLEVNVAYVFAPAFQGGGIATAAVRQMMEIVASEHPGAVFVVVAEAANERSLRLARRLGFAPAPPEVATRRLPSPSEQVWWCPPRPRQSGEAVDANRLC